MIMIEVSREKKPPCLQYEAHLPIAGSVRRALRWPAEWHGRPPWTRAKHMGETSLRPSATAGRLPMPLALPAIGRCALRHALLALRLP